MKVAVLGALDKVTAKVSTITAPINKPVKFGSLVITVRYCDQHPPEETPESTAFLEIDEMKQGEDPVRRFNGWMFASSPAVSAMEDPIYDLWVVNCKN
ncbi:MAG: DUF2155 domain-containing protein [Alphaproteobacteria bacterium]|nr:DUF2155 domain-containing protein [Alphaproteobacteria bacterium]